MKKDMIIIREAIPDDFESVKEILKSVDLPVSDLDPSLPSFLVACSCIDDDIIVGAVGLETYEQAGLIRSLSVRKDFRGKHIGDKLFDVVSINAHDRGVTDLYLLTESADSYFSRKGFKSIQRSTIPEGLKKSTQFTDVCPETATAMHRSINRNI
ncbi:MAG: arsenic resistance N-acetyltransferase ArsN2 [Bacteroidota bacterium]